MAKSKGGRPSKFKDEYCEQVIQFCRLGATNEDIAAFFDVGTTTVDRWIADNPKFRGAIKEGRELADALVGQRLFERATGYQAPDTKFATHEGKITDEREYTKHYPPDSTAMIFWLKNRRPDLWRDKVDHEHAGKDGGPIQTADVTDTELAKRVAFFLRDSVEKQKKETSE